MVQKTGTKDFILMGKGIEGRYSRCGAFWDPHLAFTRDFVRQHTQPSERVAVLGAGRLLDLDLARLLESVQEVHLFDADPTCLPVWQKSVPKNFRSRVIPRVEDITDCLGSWTSGLHEAVQRGELSQYIETLGAPMPRWADEEFDAVISLNIAGQLPLYWRDRVFEASEVTHGLLKISRPFKAWLRNARVLPQGKEIELSCDEYKALAGAYERLQLAHLSAVRRAARRWGVIVTDVEYYFYKSHRSDWIVDEALFGTARKVFNNLNTEIPALATDCWLWHLAPQFIESDEEGEIHRVEARAWTQPPRDV